MSDERRIDIVRGTDWTAMYIDGEVKVENHTLPLHEVFEALGVEVHDHSVEQKYDEQVLAFQGFPTYFDELPKDKIS